MKHAVLVVDDNADIRQMLRLALNSAFEVMEAPDAVTAWTMIRFDPPQAIVLDLMMPGSISGLQLCEMIRLDSTLNEMHVVMATACGRPAEKAYGLAVGANKYLVKPFSPLELRLHLLKALGVDSALPSIGGSKCR